MTKQITELQEKIRGLELKNNLLQQEVTRLNKSVHDKSKHKRRVNAAFNDATILVGLHAGQQPTSRRYAVANRHLTQTRWENAIGLLRMARVINNRHWASSDLAHIGSALERARQRAIESPEAFKARLNRHALGRNKHRR
jgi:hypothetical protein